MQRYRWNPHALLANRDWAGFQRRARQGSNKVVKHKRSYRKKFKPRRRENTKNPANDIIDKYHALSRGVYKRRKRITKSKKRFRKKVLKAVAKPQPINTFHMASSGVTDFNFNPAAWTTTPSQVVAANQPDWYMWGGHGSTNDLYDLTSDLSGREERYGGVDEGIKRGIMKIIITYAKFEMALVNLTSVAYDIQIYECVAARDMSVTDGYSTPYKAWTQCISDLTNETVAYTSMAITTYGSEPTDLPGFGKHWTIKNKTVLYLDQQTSTTWQVNGPKGVYDMAKMNNLYAIKGKSIGFLVVAAGRIGNGLTANVAMLRTTCSKTYHYKWPTGSEHITGVQTALVANI